MIRERHVRSQQTPQQWALSAAALGVGIAAAMVVLIGFDDPSWFGLVQLSLATGLLLQLLALVLGIGSVMGVAVGAQCIAVVVAAGQHSDRPGMLLSLLVGCLWYISAELTWEAIDWRDGVARGRSAQFARAGEIGVVAGGAALLGLLAVVGSASPPTRSIPLQALVILAVCGGGVALTNRLRASQTTAPERD